jgi:hypothetical protein
MVYITMFDEVDKWSAIFQVIEKQKQRPVGACFGHLTKTQSISEFFQIG